MAIRIESSDHTDRIHNHPHHDEDDDRLPQNAACGVDPRAKARPRQLLTIINVIQRAVAVSDRDSDERVQGTGDRIAKALIFRGRNAFVRCTEIDAMVPGYETGL